VKDIIDLEWRVVVMLLIRGKEVGGWQAYDVLGRLPLRRLACSPQNSVTLVSTDIDRKRGPAL